NVACRKIDKNKTHELTVLVTNARRSGAIIDIRDERNGNLRAGWCRNQYSLKRIEILPEVGGVTRANRITFARFNSCCNRFSANRRFNNIIHVARGQSIPRSCFAVHVEIEKVTANGAFGEGTARIRKIDNRLLDLNCEIFDALQIGTEHFYSERASE